MKEKIKMRTQVKKEKGKVEVKVLKVKKKKEKVGVEMQVKKKKSKVKSVVLTKSSGKKLRILMLNYEFPPLGGGAGNATYYLLKEFSKKKDLEIDLVTSSTDKFRTEQFASNIKIHFLPSNCFEKLLYKVNFGVFVLFFIKELII